MRSLIFVFGAFVGIAMASCGNALETKANTDSDTVVVEDTVATDTAVADTTCADCECCCD